MPTKPGTLGLREAPGLALNRGAKPAGQRRGRLEPGSRLSCPLVLKQRARILSVGLPGNIQKASAVDNGAGLSRFPRTAIWGCSVLPPADFPPSQYKTHTYTASTLLLASAPAGETKYAGGGDGRWRPECGRRGCHPLFAGRRGLVVTFQCGPPEQGGHLPRPRNPTRGAPETPDEWRGSAKERGDAHHLLGIRPPP